MLKASVYVLNKLIVKLSQTPSKWKTREPKKNKRGREKKCSFEQKFSSRLNQLQNLTWAIKKLISRASILINLLCNFRITFHQHFVRPFIFKKYILLRANECIVQNYSRLLRITYRKNRESHEVVLNIRFLKGIIFRAYKI